MPRAARAVMAFMLALAFAAAPQVLDQCAASCELARLTNASVAAPACHHAGSAAPHVRAPISDCAHDRAPALSAITYPAPSATRPLNSVHFVAPAPAGATAHVL